MSSTYRLTGRLETGELAELYDAVREDDGLPVAIKLFNPKTSDPRYATTLATTYGVLNPLASEGLVHVLDLGFVRQRLAVVREAVDGPGLGLALQRLNTKEVILPPGVALGLIIQVLEAVERAHAAGVVHGALTPGNVLLASTGLPRVCDFGALQALLAVPELKRAFAGRGRSAYRAPEVSKGGEPTSLSDIYSIGAMAYELLTLREAVIPDRGGMSTRRAALPPPSRLDRRLHARLDPILLRALEPSPSRRYGTCAEMAQALRGFLANQGGLPGAEEARHFISELFPNGVSLTTPGPVPFAEDFTLTPISGMSLAQVRAVALERSVVARSPFSPAPSDADTMDAPPAFEDYHPSLFPDTPPLGAVQAVLDPKVLESTHILGAGAPKSAPAEPGSEDTHVRGPGPAVEVTHFGAKPGKAPSGRTPAASSSRGSSGPVGPPGDDEQTWVAPPGAAPVKSTRRAPVSLAGGGEGTRVGKNPRLRVVEDFSKPPASTPAPVSVSPRGDPEDTRDTAKIEVTVTRARAPRPPAPAPPPVEPSSYAAEPAPTRSGLPAVEGGGLRGGRLFTEERNLLEDARRRRRLMSVAGGVAGVGLVCFALGVWRFAQRSQVQTDPGVAAVSGAVQEYLREPPALPPRPAPPSVPAPAPHGTAPGPEAATPASPQAFLSLKANRPARAYIDGVRIKRSLPLVNYPLKPGDREITVETLQTPRQREVFQLHLENGEHRQLEQLFPPARRR